MSLFARKAYTQEESMCIKKILMPVFLAIYCTAALSTGFLINGTPLVRASSFEALIYCVLFFLLLHYCITNSDKRKWIVSIIFGNFFSICIFVGAEFSNYQTVLEPNFLLINNFIGLLVLISCMLNIGYKMVDYLIYSDNLCNIRSRKVKLLRADGTGFIIFFCGIMICWLPAFLAVFPGIYSYDASLQVLQVFGGQGLDSHHPVIHTLILNGCIYLGKALFANYNYGIAIYSIVQSVSLVAAFAYVCVTMVKYKVPKMVVIFSFVFFAFNPLNQIWAFVTTKDVFFTVFFVLCVTYICQMIFDESFFKSKRKIGLFLISATLMCLFRNQGIYVFLLFALISILVYKKYWKKLLLGLAIVFLSVKLINLLFGTALGVEPGSVREALSVPIQQMARVHALELDYYSEEELEILYGIIPKENWNQYIPEISDPVKQGFDNQYFSEHKGDFIKLWIKTGLDNPLLYVESFLYGAYGYWYVDSSPRWMTYIWFDGFFMEPEYNILRITRDSKFPVYEQYLRKISYDLSYECIPCISVILNQGFPFWVCLFVISHNIYKKKYSACLSMVLIIGLWGTILLGPCICVRYAYPLIASIPIMIGIIFFKKIDKEPSISG